MIGSGLAARGSSRKRMLPSMPAGSFGRLPGGGQANPKGVGGKFLRGQPGAWRHGLSVGGGLVNRANSHDSLAGAMVRDASPRNVREKTILPCVLVGYRWKPYRNFTYWPSKVVTLKERTVMQAGCAQSRRANSPSLGKS